MSTTLTMRGFFERLREALHLTQVEGTDGLDRPHGEEHAITGAASYACLPCVRLEP